MKETDLAWASGFYEGEGHLTSKTGNGGPLVIISQCNREPLDKLQKLFGGSVYGPKKVKNGNQDVYVWNLTRHSESRSFVYKISPWLSDKRLGDALDKIERFANLREIRLAYCSKGHDKEKMGWRPGHNGGRICKTCESVYKKEYYNARKR